MKLEKTGTFKLTSVSEGFKGNYAEIISYLYVKNGNEILKNPLKSLEKFDVTLTCEELNEYITFLGYRPANENEARIAKSFQIDADKKKTLAFFNEEEQAWQHIDRENGDSDSMPYHIDRDELLEGLLDNSEVGILVVRK